MTDFDTYLDKIGEIGFVEEVMHSIVFASGLPKARPNEVVIFESGDIGEIISLNKENVEILILTSGNLKVGDKVARTDELLQVSVGDGCLGRAIDPLGRPLDTSKKLTNVFPKPIDTPPHGIIGRKQVEKPLETGVTLIDLVIPLAKGQRQLVIGDRKTGKTEFLLQTLLSQARRGTICIYAVIGQRLLEIKKRQEFIEANGIRDKCVVVATSSFDPAGLIFLTPYTAMTIAEHFRDNGMDVLLILDEMTTHAKFYREISLLAKRFPGRNSYPGDVFYAHARLIERAGNFKRGSISALPVAESILGDISGYIQTNLMSMTDGHIFFDIDLYNEGKRPAVSPFLSVTRVGHQAQTVLERDISRNLSNFLVNYQKMKQFMHFGAEAGETVQKVISLGRKIDILFDQPGENIIELNANILVVTGLWAGIWNQIEDSLMEKQIERVILNYQTDTRYKSEIDLLLAKVQSFSELVNLVRQTPEIITGRFNT
ncbi:MAG: ATP synthase subunit alpha [Candidatus Woesebacteria bacterium GW2011_GWA1_37_7]|uniref:ATP synthase subunit alpha n=2 Tax=Candidatus Woeseibacteriota TaxID=1752722 RepID=A0A0G0JJH8_9BACT|nr:MAG: ATP synthase subunit alpha [Candidatus Woesebacteria bacterium GW2011_GWA1_37_7]